ncbi:hypothetical protein M0R45_011080 [Rubus argutus]|uniref:Uncharacterized protein n=1 Tax=Rubus argutus TaxID=59490 RepID=A0AAW1YCN9_RUBAR
MHRVEECSRPELEGERVRARSGLGVQSGYARRSFPTNLGLRRAADCSGFRPVLRSTMARASNTASGE